MPGASWNLDQTDDAVTIRTPAVRIVLRRAGDRWSHEIGLGDGPPLLASIEHGPDAGDPSQVLSPVYQEVQHHAFDDDDRRVRLLLTGLLHRHHFSAVLTVSTDDDGGAAIEFDVADRCRDVVSSLAATYEVRLGPGDLQEADETAVRWDGGPLGDGRLTFTAIEASRLAIAGKGPRAVQAQALASLAPGSFTHRLRYRWAWASRSCRTR
ncbi:hypothetical protein [Paludisphaera mucosa]|uniref:Uncharacterized protein n=1 Tax=Paludisphaera mucosa TaxID=3030827 RepID=A0ABT6FFN5_9BACT|nr:hypothetical protein [Paludisphaera mucosa]MDG3006378.1 hypothetical protein [Paludisphaera mucosa]